MKNFLQFLGLLVVVAGVSFGLSLFVSTRSGSQSVGEALTNRFNGTSSSYNGTAVALKKISSEEASAPFLLPGKSEIRYYVARTGEIKSARLEGSATPVVLGTIKLRALSLTWSPDGNQAIATYATERISINLKTKATKTLAKNILSPQFSKSTNDVAYLYFDDKAEEGAISIGDSQFVNFKNILKTRLKSWEIQWNSTRRLSLIATAHTSDLESLYLLDTQSKAFTQLAADQENLETVWSPDGERLLYSAQRGKTAQLYIMSLATKTPISLDLPIAASKCAWDSNGKTAYCGVSELSLKSVKDKNAEDAVVRIDATASHPEPQVIMTAVEAGFVDMRFVSYTNAIHALIFKNFKDGRLYELSLP